MKNPFIQIRPMLRIARSLEEIARALTYFALADARENGRFYLTRPHPLSLKDESELLHTDSEAIDRLRREEEELVLQRGYPALDELEDARD